MKRFILAHYLSLAPPHNTRHGDDFIQQSCKKAADYEHTLNYTFCVTTLNADPSSRSADLYGLANITIHLAFAKVSRIAAHIHKLKKDPKIDQPALQDCEELYDDAPDNVQAAIDSFIEKDYMSALGGISSALEAPDTCETGFKERKAVSPLKEEDECFAQLGVISLVFIGMLRGT